MANIVEKFKAKSKKQKKSALYGFLIFLGLFMILIAVMASIKVPVWLDYENPQYGIEMKYPGHWRKIDELPAGAIVAFALLPESPMDFYSPNLNVTFHDTRGQKMSPAQFNKEAIRQLVGLFGGYVKVLVSKPAKLAGIKGYRYEYVGDIVGKKLPGNMEIPEEYRKNPAQYLHVWALTDKGAYIITYTALKNDFRKHLGLVNGMIRSFKLID